MMKLEYKKVAFALKHNFGISREIKTAANNVVVKISCDIEGKTYSGYGEAIPSKFYGETQDTILAFLSWVEKENILGDDPFEVVSIQQKLCAFKNNNAAKSAIDMALLDLRCKILDMPAYKFLGLHNKPLKTSYTIDISDIGKILEKTGKALMAGYTIFKVKLGTRIDEEIIFSIRQAAPEATIYVDANCAWDLKMGLKMLKVMEDNKVELIEQPFRADDYDAYRLIRSQTTIPIFADESCVNLSDLSRLKDIVDGVNIKVSKVGGITNALKMAEMARVYNLRVMVGCFLESTLGIAAGCLPALYADYVDLDGFMFLKEEPYSLIDVDCASIRIKEVNGITGKAIF